MRIAILGSGAWGSGLAIALARAHAVTLWVREPARSQEFERTRENARYLRGHRIPDNVRITGDFAEAAAAEVCLVATPVAGLRGTLENLKRIGFAGPVIWACKGIELESGLFPHEVLAQVMGSDHPCAALSGPSFADEVARGLPTAVTLASSDLDLAKQLVSALSDRRFRLYANDDLIGVEIGGAVKNVLAIATGVSDGMGFGLNARAALITRGLAEMARLSEALGGRRETMMGLAGLGDLVLTCTGDLSRNRRVGLGLATGEALSQILSRLGHIAEGVYTAREVLQFSRRYAIEMPICLAVAAVLFDGLSPKAAVEQLLSRDPKVE